MCGFDVCGFAQNRTVEQNVTDGYPMVASSLLYDPLCGTDTPQPMATVCVCVRVGGCV